MKCKEEGSKVHVRVGRRVKEKRGKHEDTPRMEERMGREGKGGPDGTGCDVDKEGLW